MSKFNTNGIPGSYVKVNVVNPGSAAEPGFNALCIIGSARNGIPYSAGNGDVVIKPFSSQGDAEAYFGKSPLTDAFGYAKSGGVGIAHLLNAAPITQGSVVLQDSAGTPANTLMLKPVSYGAGANDIKITIATDGTDVTMTFLPPKNTIFLTSNSGTTSKILSVEHTQNLAVGQTIILTANDQSTPESKTIVAVDAANKTVEIDSVATVDFTTAQYARIFQADTSNQEIIEYTTSTSVTDLIAQINKGDLFIASRESYSGDLPADQSAEYFQNLTSATKGTSPVATTTSEGDFDTLKASAAQLFDQYEGATGTRMRIVNVVASEAAVHAVYAGLVNERKTASRPIILVVGVAVDDIDAATSASNYPGKRAENLNNDSVVLCGIGIDNKAAYLSFAPLFAGMLAASQPNANLTNDPISVSAVEKRISAYNEVSLLAPLLAKGVVVPRTTNSGTVIARAISTYQNQSTPWTLENRTYLIQQRQIVDYVQKALLTGTESYAGTNATETNVIMAVREILQAIVNNGTIVSYSIAEKSKSGDTITVKPVIEPTVGVDFILNDITVNVNDQAA